MTDGFQLFCGPCQNVFPLLPNIKDLRSSWGQPWLHVGCPACGVEVEVPLSRSAYLGLRARWWRFLLDRLVVENRLRSALDGEGAAARIGGRHG